ncbi:MAG: DNA polymerase III subunit delta [Bryobacteraceae bacterium]|nr:DNA polymerase III subunit delta [Bryobacteraceae bacterium]
MTPEQFLTSLKKQAPAAVYLFLGPDGCERDRCRRALREAALPPDLREDGFTRRDLDEDNLSSVLDDANSMSLFASERLIWASGAEGALPKRLTTTEDKDPADATSQLKRFIAQPPPGVTLVFDSLRFDFEGEDKAKTERVRKYYAAIPNVVEFPRFTPAAARQLVTKLAAERKIAIGAAETDLLVEALNADASRLANELEKLSLYCGPGGKVTLELIADLVPNARSSNVFALVSAIGRGDRLESLSILDTLVRDGEYLPLALTFLATQFRLALAAQEAGVKNSFQIQSHFQKLGIMMWKSRADQVAETVAKLPRGKLARAIRHLYAADQAFREPRPDDRAVMESLVWKLTA